MAAIGTAGATFEADKTSCGKTDESFLRQRQNRSNPVTQSHGSNETASSAKSSLAAAAKSAKLDGRAAEEMLRKQSLGAHLRFIRWVLFFVD
jgi:hypothetical protein